MHELPDFLHWWDVVFRCLPTFLLVFGLGAGGCGDSAQPSRDAGAPPPTDSGFFFDSGRPDSGFDAGRGPVDATALDADNDAGGGTVARPVAAQVEEFTTSSINFVDVPGAALELLAGPAHWWIVLLSGRVCTDTIAAPSVEARFVIDAIEQGLGGVAVSPASHCGSIQHLAALPPGSSLHRLQVALRNVTGDNATLADLNLVAFPLATTADVHTVENLPVQEVTSATPTPVSSLTFTPSAAGDYLVFSVVSAFEEFGSNNVFVQTRDEIAGDNWPSPPFQMSRTSWQTFFSVERRSFDTNEQTVTVLANHGPASGGNVRGARIVAFRADALPYLESETTASRTASGTDDVLVTELTSSPPLTVSSQITVQSMASNVQCGLDGDHQPSFVVDADAQVISHSLNCGTRASYGRVSLLNSANPITLENRLSAVVAGNAAVATDSVIHVLGL